MLSVDGNAGAAVETRIRNGWNKFRQLVPMLTNKDISLIVGGRLYRREIVEKDCQARGLNGEDAMDRIRWMKQIRDRLMTTIGMSGRMFLLVLVTRVVPDKIYRAVKQLCVCVCPCPTTWQLQFGYFKFL